MAQSIFKIILGFALFCSCMCLEAGLVRTIRCGLNTSRLYKKVKGRELVEITDDLLASGRLDPQVERAIRNRGRRVFLFEYPSDGRQIKGYISFVPQAENQKLLVLLRGGSGIYLIRSPESSINFLDDHTVISTTYRGGPSPGRDEFGGADVADVKHLVDFIPILEKKLDLKITSREKVAIGFSRGAMQLFVALKRYPDLGAYFDRAIVVSGLLDFERFLTDHPFAKRMIHFFLHQRPTQEWISARNPMCHVDCYPNDLPLLVVQGGGDSLIEPSMGKAMVQKLKDRGCQVEYCEHPTAGHCSQRLNPMVLDWLSLPLDDAN